MSAGCGGGGSNRSHNRRMSAAARPRHAIVRVDRSQGWPLWDAAGTRALEEQARAALPPGTLMQRAGQAVARLARALAPHAGQAWIMAGPGGNGGDGLHAAAELRQAGLEVTVTLVAEPDALAPEPAAALARARAAGCVIGTELPRAAPPLAIDALLGLGAGRAPGGAFLAAIQAFNNMPGCRLAVDLPSGLHPDTGARLGHDAAYAHATLGLLTLKPALFTGAGRDHAGQAWFDDLGCEAGDAVPGPVARLASGADVSAALVPRAHDRHKGSFGDVLVVGGAPGMVGALRLAAQGALAAGPGRVFVSPLDPDLTLADPQHPEWLWTPQAWLPGRHALESDTVVCGCGGGAIVSEALPAILGRAARLVLDADALNAVSRDPQLRRQLSARRARGQSTVLTPHPLEAARLLGCDTAEVQADRPKAARELATLLGTIVVLKGSGTLVASAGRLPVVNPTGSASLAVGGTGDVLAGWIAGQWAVCSAGERDTHGESGWRSAVAATWLHGLAGERPAGAPIQAGHLAGSMAAQAEAWRSIREAERLSGACASLP